MSANLSNRIWAVLVEAQSFIGFSAGEGPLAMLPGTHIIQSARYQNIQSNNWERSILRIMKKEKVDVKKEMKFKWKEQSLLVKIMKLGSNVKINDI